MKPTQNIALIAFDDLYSMYMFVQDDLARLQAPRKDLQNAEDVEMVSERLKRIEKELYERAYGRVLNFAVEVEAVPPEQIDLSQFDTKG